MGSKKEVIFRVRFTRESFEHLKRVAEERGMSMADLVRGLVLRSVEDPEYCRECKERLKLEIAMVLGRELNRIGVNLNQIARWVNRYKKEADGARVMYLLSEIKKALERLSYVGEVGKQKQERGIGS